MRRWIRSDGNGADLGMADQERREIVPLKAITKLPTDRNWYLHDSDDMRPGAGMKTGDRARNGSRTPPPGWSPSPSPRAPARQDENHRDAGADDPAGP